MRGNAAVGSFERMVFQEIKFGLSAVTRFRFISTNDVRIALAVKHDDRDWCDVVAPKPKGEEHDVYGFNVTEQRWSYNTRAQGLAGDRGQGSTMGRGAGDTQEQLLTMAGGPPLHAFLNHGNVVAHPSAVLRRVRNKQSALFLLTHGANKW